MDLENYHGDEDEDEGMVEGAGSHTPPREDALTVYKGHSGNVLFD